MAHVSLRFDLTENRVTRLGNAGVSSLKDLHRVLAALDLRAVVELREIDLAQPKPEPKP